MLWCALCNEEQVAQSNLGLKLYSYVIKRRLARGWPMSARWVGGCSRVKRQLDNQKNVPALPVPSEAQNVGCAVQDNLCVQTDDCEAGAVPSYLYMEAVAERAVKTFHVWLQAQQQQAPLSESIIGNAWWGQWLEWSVHIGFESQANLWTRPMPSTLISDSQG